MHLTLLVLSAGSHKFLRTNNQEIIITSFSSGCLLFGTLLFSFLKLCKIANQLATKNKINNFYITYSIFYLELYISL